MSIAGKSVLEIGAGVGIVGLVAAALGAKPVLITDLPHLVPHINANIQVRGFRVMRRALGSGAGRNARVLIA